MPLKIDKLIATEMVLNGTELTSEYGLLSCKIQIDGTTGLVNTDNVTDFLVRFNDTVYNTSPSTFQIVNSKIQVQTSGRYMVLARYSSYDMTDGTDFLRVGVISATTSNNGDLGTKIEYLDTGYIGTTSAGEASKGGSTILKLNGGEWIGLVGFHAGANGGNGNQGYPVFDNAFFNQPYLEIIKIGN